MFGKNCKTIGLYLTSLSDRYQGAVWAGVCAEAEKHKINLVCVRGERQNSPDIYEKQANILYEITGKECFDGLIILSNAVGTFCSPGELKEFFSRYKGIPVVSAGYELKGFPGISLDNHPGMTALVSHLVNDHGYKKFLYISGPTSHWESEIRFRAYTSVLEAAGLSLEDQLYTGGDFSQESGNEAILNFSQKELESVEAVIAANDSMAFGAMEELRNLGFSIPGDVAVTGFDDTNDCRYTIPTLTTVRQPLVKEGREAVRMLLHMMEKGGRTGNIKLSTEFITRESCGCLNRSLKRIPLAGEKSSFSRGVAEIRNKLSYTLLKSSPLIIDFIDRGMEMIEQALKGRQEKSFFSFWQEGLRNRIFTKTILGVLNDFTEELLFSLPSYFDKNEDLIFASSLLYQCRLYLMELESRKQVGERLEYEKMFQVLETISTRLMSTLEESDLTKILTDAMIRLEIPELFLVLYDNARKKNFDRSRLVYYYNRNGGVDLGDNGISFPTKELLPPGFQQSGRNIVYIIEALYVREQQLGYIVAEMGPRYGEIYDTLRLKLNSAVYSLELVRKVKEHAGRLEREVAERTADLLQSNEELTLQIKKRQKADAALRESERTLRSITEAIPIPLFIMRKKDSGIIYSNKPFMDLFGKGFDLFRSVFKGAGARNPLPPEACPGVELKLKDCHGKEVWMIATVRNIRFEGIPSVIVGLNDISETKRLQKKILEISEETRRIIGLDLHDQVCGNLAGISIMTTVVSNELKISDPALSSQVREIGDLINGCIDDITRIARGLYPTDLENSGLSVALLMTAEQAARQYNVPCHINIKDGIQIKGKERQLHFFRICQELICNAFKHSGAEKIGVTLLGGINEVAVIIDDDGKGFDPSDSKSDRMGLRSINYRAGLIDGELSISPRPGGGTRARCVIKEVQDE